MSENLERAFDVIVNDHLALLFWLQDKYPDVFKERFGNVSIVHLMKNSELVSIMGGSQ